MQDYLSTLFDWDRKFYSFSRAEQDQNPYSIIRKDNKVILVHNIIGINKDDLKITVKTENGHKFIYINGTTKNQTTEQTYSVNSRFEIRSQDIKKITSHIENGLLYITIEYKKPKEEIIDIEVK